MKAKQFVGLIAACSIASFLGSLVANAYWAQSVARADISTGNGGGLSSVNLSVSALTAGTDAGSGLCGNGTSGSPLSLCQIINEALTFNGSISLGSALSSGYTVTSLPTAGPLTLASDANGTNGIGSQVTASDLPTPTAVSGPSSPGGVFSILVPSSSTTPAPNAIYVEHSGNDPTVLISDVPTTSTYDIWDVGTHGACEANSQFLMNWLANGTSNATLNCGGTFTVSQNNIVDTQSNILAEGTVVGEGQFISAGGTADPNVKGAFVAGSHGIFEQSSNCAQTTSTGSPSTVTLNQWGCLLTNGSTSNAYDFTLTFPGSVTLANSPLCFVEVLSTNATANPDVTACVPSTTKVDVYWNSAEPPANGTQFMVLIFGNGT